MHMHAYIHMHMHTHTHLHHACPSLTSAQLLLNACVLLVAIKTMNKVASHINEMQKIYEDYGMVFDQLVAEQSGTEKEVSGGFGLGSFMAGWISLG